MKQRTYVVRLNGIYGIEKTGTNRDSKTKWLTGVFITINHGTSVVTTCGEFYTYQKRCSESFFDVHLDGQWYDICSREADDIMLHHWKEDNL